jgi:hypothetical protein
MATKRLSTLMKRAGALMPICEREVEKPAVAVRTRRIDPSFIEHTIQTFEKVSTPGPNLRAAIIAMLRELHRQETKQLPPTPDRVTTEQR